MVFPGDLPGTVKVGVDLVSARLAPKEGLRRAVAPMHMSTLAATLAGVPGVDGLHDRADILSFVGGEASKLGIAPTVMPTPLAPPSLLGACADLGQVLDHDHAARPCALDNLFGENVVAIPPKQSLSAAHLFQMPLGRFRAFGLEFALEPEIPRFNLLPFSLPKELGGGCDGWSVDAEVNPDDATGRNEFRRLNVHDGVQPPTRRAAQQVCCNKATGLIEPFLGLTARRKGQFYTTGDGGKPDDSFVLFDAEAACVVTHHAAIPVRRRNLFAFLLQRKCRAQCFGRLHAGRNHKLGRQVRMRLAQVGVCRLMERNTVLLAPFPAQPSDSVKASTRGRQCRRQDRVLVGRQLKSNAHRALHTSCMEEISAMYKGLGRHFKPRSSPIKQALWLEYPRGGFR
jgi:hypothetical protein